MYQNLQLFLGILGVISLFLIFFALLTLLIIKNKKNSKEISVEIKCLNKFYEENKNKLLRQILSTKEYKKAKKQKPDIKKDKRIFLLDFNGNVSASGLPILREQITAILQIASTDDEVVLRLESAGGYVHSYGLASSQLARLRENNIPLTICVDKIAASGGYMMACIANKIIAAPFAILGSIGVVANIPNFNKVLQKNDIDYLEMTAGEYKRTLTMLGAISEKGKIKFQAQLEETHQLFKEHIAKYRSELNLQQIATGEYWLGTKALEYNLVDKLQTSDDYLLNASENCKIYNIYSPKKEGLKERLISLTTLCLTAFYEKKIELNSDYPMLVKAG